MRFSATCGCYSNWVSNAVVLYLPEHSKDPTIYAPKLLNSLLADIVDAFDPDEAVVTKSGGVQDEGDESSVLKGGWFVYRRGEDIVENKDFPRPQ
jgi:hypothetical protein